MFGQRAHASHAGARSPASPQEVLGGEDAPPRCAAPPASLLAAVARAPRRARLARAAQAHLLAGELSVAGPPWRALALATAMAGGGCVGPSSAPAPQRPAPDNDDASASTGAMAPLAAADPASDDAGGEPTPPSCAGLAVCDDFEAEAPGSPPSPERWTVVAAKGDRVEVDAMRAKWGSQSLKISAANREYGRTMLVNTTAFPPTPNQIFGRLHFYIDLETMPANHIDLVSARGTLPGQSKPTFLSYGSQFRLFLANYYNDADPDRVLDLWQHAGVAKGGTWQDATYVPTRRWACLQWVISGDGNQMRMWLDGQPVPRMHVDGAAPACCPDKPWTVPPLAEVAMGWAFVPVRDSVPVPPVAMWLDGVALHSAPIACDR